MLELPVSAFPNQNFQVILNNQNCTINLYQRKESLYMDLFVGDKEIGRGMICLPTVSIPMFNTNFIGKIFVVDEWSEPKFQEPPKWNGLGDRWKFYYLDENDLAMINAQ